MGRLRTMGGSMARWYCRPRSSKTVVASEIVQPTRRRVHELERELDRMRSGQIVVDARKKLNVLHNKSAAQEANVSRARRALDECNGNLAQHATASRTGTIVSTRQRKQEQQQLDHCRKLTSSL